MCYSTRMCYYTLARVRGCLIANVHFPVVPAQIPGYAMLLSSINRINRSKFPVVVTATIAHVGWPFFFLPSVFALFCYSKEKQQNTRFFFLPFFFFTTKREIRTRKNNYRITVIMGQILLLSWVWAIYLSLPCRL